MPHLIGNWYPQIRFYFLVIWLKKVKWVHNLLVMCDYPWPSDPSLFPLARQPAFAVSLTSLHFYRLSHSNAFLTTAIETTVLYKSTQVTPQHLNKIFHRFPDLLFQTQWIATKKVVRLRIRCTNLNLEYIPCLLEKAASLSF